MDNKYQTRAASELEWFWNYSEADCGISSNFNAMVNVALYGAPTHYDDHYDNKVLKAVSLNRKIQTALNSLSKISYKVLYVSFSSEQLNPYVVKMFQQYAGVSYLIHGLDIEMLATRFYTNQCAAREKILVTEIRNEAREKYNKALNQYIKIRSKNEK